jgi:hypothetical protein
MNNAPQGEGFIYFLRMELLNCYGCLNQIG